MQSNRAIQGLNPTWKLISSYFKSVCIFIIFIVAAANTYAHMPSKIDIPEKIKADTSANAMAIKKMLMQYESLRATNMDQALAVLQDVLEQSRATGFSWGESTALNRFGHEYQAKGEHTKALKYMLQALPKAETPDNIGISNILYNNIGLSYSAIGKYELALKYYNKGLAIVGRIKMQNGTDSIGLYNNIGIMWARLDEINYALSTFLLTEKIILRNKDTLQSAMTYLNIATCYYRMQQWELSEMYYKKAIVVAEQKHLPGHLSTALAGLGSLYRQRGELKKALEYVDRAFAIKDFPNMTAYELMSRDLLKGDIYLDTKEYAKAKPLLLNTLAKANKMQHQELREALEPLISKMYAELGQYHDAYQHLLNYNQIKDTLLKQEKERSLKAWMNVMMAEKNKEVLAQKLQIAGQKNKLQKKNIWIGGAILSSLLLLSVGLVFFRNYRHRQAIQQSLIYQLQQTQEINQLKAQVRGEEHERQRIAHELHDNIAAQLWGIKMNVDNIQKLEKTNLLYDKKLATVFQQLSDAAQDVRKTAHNLMPDLLLEEGLAAALASVCNRVSKNTNLEVDFQEYGIVPRIDKEIELSIYRMVQELIQNVMKHAKAATHMLVQISCAGTMLNITVEDNGNTFVKNENGIGLQQIKKRTQALSGHFDLQSIPGKGSTAYLEFDLQHFL